MLHQVWLQEVLHNNLGKIEQTDVRLHEHTDTAIPVHYSLFRFEGLMNKDEVQTYVWTNLRNTDKQNVLWP